MPRWSERHQRLRFLQGHRPSAAAVQAAYQARKAWREEATREADQGSEALVKRVTRGEDYIRCVQSFL